jgi:hypothetical protein
MKNQENQDYTNVFKQSQRENRAYSRGYMDAFYQKNKCNPYEVNSSTYQEYETGFRAAKGWN